MWHTLQTALTPYILSPLTVLLCLLATGGWVLGARRLARQGRAPSVWRTLSFFTGLLLCYAVIHTQFDYYARYMFFMHRIQHLVLHHLGAFLIALANPLPVLAADGHMPDFIDLIKSLDLKTDVYMLKKDTVDVFAKVRGRRAGERASERAPTAVNRAKKQRKQTKKRKPKPHKYTAGTEREKASAPCVPVCVCVRACGRVWGREKRKREAKKP